MSPDPHAELCVPVVVPVVVVGSVVAVVVGSVVFVVVVGSVVIVVPSLVVPGSGGGGSLHASAPTRGLKLMRAA
jgi:hypothetical protein